MNYLDFIYDYEKSTSEQDKKMKGVVYTPFFIVDYILDKALSCEWNTKVIDPACGSGIFLFAALDRIHSATNKPYHLIVEENLWGVDSDPEVVKFTSSMLIEYSNQKCGIRPKVNIICGDSTDKNFLSKIGTFDVVAGNPPYVRIQNIPEEKRAFLNDWTFVAGDSDLYIAFIELGFSLLNENGKLGYITPNSWLKNKSTIKLLNHVVGNRLAREIIDFGDTQIFGDKAQTYSSILIAGNKPSETITIKTDLNSGEVKNYKFVSPKTVMVPAAKEKWLSKVEGGTRLKDKFKIRVGLATLADNIFLHSDVEPEILKPCVKVSRLRDINDKCNIIYPYRIQKGKAIPLTEQELWGQYPIAASYLDSKRPILEKRDRGKVKNWWLYGRTQGLTSLFGKKLLMPPMVKEPRFILCEDEDLLYLSGYAIFGERLDLLKVVLESELFREYIHLTGKDFRGGWKGCSKHSIENFSIPDILEGEEEELFGDPNKFLKRKYGV